MIRRAFFGEKAALTLLDGALSLLVLGLSIQLVNAFAEERAIAPLLPAAFFAASTLFRVVRALLYRETDRRDFIRDLAGGALLLVGALLLAVMKNVDAALIVAGFLYFLTLMLDRVMSVVKRPKPLNIIWNVALAALLFVVRRSVAIIVAVSILQVMAEIVRIAFSQLRMDILLKIIRTSNAAELLFGITLLILSFSMLLPMLEDNIDDFSSALWYCFAIVSTIGFGDVTAVSLPGRIISMLLGLCGLVVVSIVMSIIVNLYNETKDMEKARDEAPPEQEDSAGQKKR